MTTHGGFDGAATATIVVAAIAAVASIYGSRVTGDLERLRRRLAQDIDAWSKLPAGTAKENMMRLIESETDALVVDLSLPYRRQAREQAKWGIVFLFLAAFLPLVTVTEWGTLENLGWVAIPMLLVTAGVAWNGIRLLADAVRLWAQAAGLRRQRRQTGRA